MEKLVERLWRENEGLRARNAELDKFCRDATVDMTAAMRRVELYLQRANRHLGTDARSVAAKEDIRSIAEEVAKVSNLTESLLNYTQLLTTTMKIADLRFRDVLERVVQDRCAAGDELQIVFEGYWPHMWAGEGALRLAFEAIVDNSVHYAKEGRIACIDASCYVEGGRVMVRLSDHGQGFDPAKCGRVFRPMTSLSRGAGPGMGLAIVARVMELHEGTAKAETVPGRGTTIELSFPESRIVGSAELHTPMAVGY